MIVILQPGRLVNWARAEKHWIAHLRDWQLQ